MATICIFSALYSPSMGGVERFTENIARELAGNGHDVVIVTNDTHHQGSHGVPFAGVEIWRLSCLNLLNGRYPVPVASADNYQVIKKLCCRHFDGMLINTRFYLHSLLGVRLAKCCGIRPIILDHGSAYLSFGSPLADWVVARYEDLVTSYIRRQSVEFCAISEKSADWLKHFGITAQGVIPNSIDAVSFREQSTGRSFRNELGIGNDFMIAFSGRFIPEKGISVLIEMMEMLDDLPVHLVAAGEGPLCGTMEESGIDKLHVVGRLKSGDIAALLMESDLFCLPSRSEGFSTALLEASACGTPSLVTDVGGARELIPSQDYGFIEPIADPAAFAEIVRRMVPNRAGMQVMGERCRRRVEGTCSWNTVAETLLGFLNNA